MKLLSFYYTRDFYSWKVAILFYAYKNTPTTEENNEPVESPSETPIEEPKRTVVDIFMKHYDIWDEFVLPNDWVSTVGFLDVDFDGELELVISHMAGSARSTDFEIYKVNGDKIYKMNATYPADSNPDFPDNELKLYRDENNNMEYYGEDYFNGGASLKEFTFCSFAYHPSSNSIARTNYFSSVYETLYNYETESFDETHWWYNCETKSKISEEEYNQLEKDKLASLTDLNLTYKFTDIRNLKSADEIRDALQESYDAFSYDGYGSTTAPVDDTPTDPKEEISGKCGENAYWSFDETTGRLTISGTGEMDYPIADAVPWDAYRNKINQVFISEGITGVVFDFLNLTSYTNLKSFVMAESISSVLPNISPVYFDSLLKPYIIYGYTGSEAELLAQTHKATFYALNGENFTYVSCPDTMMAIKNNEGGYNSNIVPIQLIVKNEGKYDLTNVFANLNLPEGVTCDEEVKNLNFSLKSGETQTFDIDLYVRDEIFFKPVVFETEKGNVVTFSVEIGANDQENLNPETKNIVSIISTPTETIPKSFNIVTENSVNNELNSNDVFKFTNCEEDFFNSYEYYGNRMDDVNDYFNIGIRGINSYRHYQISNEAFNHLLYGDKKTGKQFDNIVKAYVEKKRQRKWNGSCHGMSTVVSLVKGGYLNLSDFGLDSDITKLDFPKNDSRVENLVNFYHLQQYLPSSYNEELNRIYLYHIYSDNNAKVASLKEIVQKTRKVKQGGLPVRIDYGFEKKNEIKGHSVLGYHCECVAKMDENGNHRIVADEDDPDFYEYQITIYDCSKTGSNIYTPTYMYIGKNYDYCWYNGYLVKEIRGVSSSFEELNLVDYKTGNWSSICSDHYEANWLASIAKNSNVHISTSNKKAKLSRMGEGEGDLYTYTVPDTGVALDGDGNEIPNNSYATYFADDFKDEDITLTLEDTDECDFSMIYTNCMVTANGSKVNQVNMESEGAVKIQADNSDYEVSLTFNEGYYSMPWYTITASGDSANTVAMEKTEDGIVLNSDNMENVSVIANNFTDEVQLAFSADTDSVLITNNNNSLEIYSDNDNNGTYETLVKTSAPTVEPKSDED